MEIKLIENLVLIFGNQINTKIEFFDHESENRAIIKFLIKN